MMKFGMKIAWDPEKEIGIAFLVYWKIVQFPRANYNQINRRQSRMQYLAIVIKKSTIIRSNLLLCTSSKRKRNLLINNDYTSSSIHNKDTEMNLW